MFLSYLGREARKVPGLGDASPSASPRSSRQLVMRLSRSSVVRHGEDDKTQTGMVNNSQPDRDRADELKLARNRVGVYISRIEIKNFGTSTT